MFSRNIHGFDSTPPFEIKIKVKEPIFKEHFKTIYVDVVYFDSRGNKKTRQQKKIVPIEDND